MNIFKCFLVILILAVLTACRPEPDFDTLRSEILAMHRGFIQAHLEKDADIIIKPNSPDYLSVKNGSVEHIRAKDMREMMTAYLNETAFSEYRDIEDPIIGFSDDGSLAWSIVQVRVAGTRTMEGDSTYSYDTRWAWLTLYHRDGDGWLRLADVSTNRPYEPEEEGQ